MSGGAMGGSGAPKGKYRAMSPASGGYGGGSRVVTVKYQNSIYDQGHSRGTSSNLVHNVIDNMGKESRQDDKQVIIFTLN